MAGLYPDVPGPRMAYHRDGSVGFKINPSVLITLLSASELQTLNDEDDTLLYSTGYTSTPGQQSGNWYWGLIFPELRDINGVYFNFSYHPNGQGLPGEYAWSADTTNGWDGTWTTIASTFPFRNETMFGNYRNNITALSLTGVKAMRWRIAAAGVDWAAAYIRGIHLYGKPVAAAARYLVFTDTSDVEVTGPYFDFADDPRGIGSEDKTFKVKNGHATLTANGIVLSTSVLTNKSPSHADDYTFSSDGSTFSATLNIGNLAPGASSGTLYVRRTTPANATLGLEAGMIVAAPTSWS